MLLAIQTRDDRLDNPFGFIRVSKGRYQPMRGFSSFHAAARFCTARDELRVSFRHRARMHGAVPLWVQREQSPTIPCSRTRRTPPGMLATRTSIPGGTEVRQPCAGTRRNRNVDNTYTHPEQRPTEPPVLSFPGEAWDRAAATEDRAHRCPEWAGTERTGGHAPNQRTTPRGEGCR